MTRKIFISYRRSDNPDFVDRIRDWFIHRYGRANVFMDFDSIPPGVKFADYIRATIQQSDTVIAVIGPRWLELLREKDMSDVKLIIGGIIPDEDAEALKRQGVAAVFQPGASLDSIVTFIRSSLP